WPGNVRELLNVARRLSISLTGQGLVRAADLEAALAEGRTMPREPFPAELLRAHPYQELRRGLELENLRGLWARHQGNLAAIASELRTTVRSVYRRFERLGLKPKQFRQNWSGPGGLG